MITAFNLKLDQQILPGLVALGKFDGVTPSLALGTTGGKVLLHSPHEKSVDDPNEWMGSGAYDTTTNSRHLNFNRKITSLAAGSFAGSSSSGAGGAPVPDLLFIGTDTSLLAYNVERNADVFFKDATDGVNCLLVGKEGTASQPMVLAGGNCSILGFDEKGEEALWTVTGDNVSSLALCDVDADGHLEMLVGSDDFEIRVFRREELLHEISETDKVQFLCPLIGSKLQSKCFAYGLANGTVGVYNGVAERAWRVKTKHKVTALHACDIDGDGKPEVISGWSNGSVSIRRFHNGEVIFKTQLGASIAGIVSGDYRMDGTNLVIACTETGEVHGFTVADAEKLKPLTEGGIIKAANKDQLALEELQEKKQLLAGELRVLAKDTQSAISGESSDAPKASELSFSMEPSEEKGCIVLSVEYMPEGGYISNLIAIDEEGNLLENAEVLAVSPVGLSKTAKVHLRPSKIQVGIIRVQVHISARSFTQQLHVLQVDIEIPRFVGFKQVPDSTGRAKPSGRVVFKMPLGCTIAHLADWIRSNFLLPTPIQSNGEKIKALFCTVLPSKGSGEMSTVEPEQLPHGISRPPNFAPIGSPVYILGKIEEDSKLCVSVHCDSMEIAGEIVQDLVRHFKLNDLISESDFPREIEHFRQVLEKVADYNAARLRLSADMADDLQRVKALVVRAEDSRLLNDMALMRRAYTELHALSNQLIGGYNIRAGNHGGLLAALKEVNQMIQKAANLRAGQAKTSIIADSRAALKKNNSELLVKIVADLVK